MTNGRPIWGFRLQFLSALAVAVSVLLAVAGSAGAAAWSLAFNDDVNTYVAPGSTVTYFLEAKNIGVTSTGGGPGDVTQVTVTLPAGVTATAAGDRNGFWVCGGVGTSVVSCQLPGFDIGPGEAVLELPVTGAVDGGAAAGVLPAATAEIAGGGGDSGVNVPTLSDGVTPCGYSGSVTAFEPACASASSKTILIDPSPEFGIDAFDGAVLANPLGDAFTQAGGHPFGISTAFRFSTDTDAVSGPVWPVEPTKDILVDLPPGFAGYPVGTARCELADLAPTPSALGADPVCSSESQIGAADITASFGDATRAPIALKSVPVYNMVPPSNAPARFGMNVAGSVVLLDFELRSGTDYGLSINVRNVSEGLAVIRNNITIWGFPAADVHTPERRCPATGALGCTSHADPTKPFLRNATSCTPAGVGLPTLLHADSWFDPGDFKQASFISHLPPGFPLTPGQWGDPQGPTGCDLVPFSASLTAAPADARTNAPSAFSFDLTMPQDDVVPQGGVDGIAPADLKKAVVTLPAGVRVSPSAAQGLDACTETQVGLHNADPSACPPGSKVGSLTINTPLLDAPLSGSIYLATPHANQFGSLIAIYLVARGPGLVVKLPGKVELDAKTGQITTTFDNNPQTPFSHLHLEFSGGDRAQLVNPPACGSYSTHSVFTSWSGRTVSSDGSFQVNVNNAGKPCPVKQAFTPHFTAGVDNTTAGKHTAFRMSLSRDDDDQELGGLTLDLPKGLLADFSDVPLCGEEQANKGTCGPETLLGKVVTGAGAGQFPFVLDGRAYITGPHNGGPFGLSIVVPAIAGPFNLGNVVVRASIRVNRTTAQASIVSDPLPQVLQGIRLQVRLVRVSADRPDFMINPTNCEKQTVHGTITAVGGDTAQVSSPFRVGNCAALALKPQLKISIGSRGHTSLGKSVALTATLTQGRGQSNLSSVRVTLPDTLNAKLPVVTNACTLDQFHAGNCEKARTGTAVAITPLLKKPLKGSAYFVKDPTKPKGSLPNLIVALRGQVDFDLIGKIRIPSSGVLGTDFDTIPDVPISKFSLHLFSGKHGAVGAAKNLCTRKSKHAGASTAIEGQNGRILHEQKHVQVVGCKRRK